VVELLLNDCFFRHNVYFYYHDAYLTLPLLYILFLEFITLSLFSWQTLNVSLLRKSKYCKLPLLGRQSFTSN
jgi:hypothetical protein